MAVSKDFPCKVCGHQAKHHYVNVSGEAKVCAECNTRTGWVQFNEEFHDFVGDNLAYMELEKKKQEILNEQTR